MRSSDTRHKQVVHSTNDRVLTRDLSLSVFFPMYNERPSVERMVARALSVLERLSSDYEVLIVDDGSTDGSQDLVQALAASNSHVRVIRHPHNLGYGAALRTGFSHATKELVFYTDCDEPVDLCELERALDLLQPEIDLVVGYRLRRHDTPRRWVYSRVYNLLVRLFFGVPVRDVNFSFKLIRRSVLLKVELDAESTFVDGELLAEAVRIGCAIAEIGVEYYPRQCGRSSFDSWRAAAHALGEMIGYLGRTRLSSFAFVHGDTSLARLMTLLAFPNPAVEPQIWHAPAETVGFCAMMLLACWDLGRWTWPWVRCWWHTFLQKAPLQDTARTSS